MPLNPPWTDEEIILAYDLYLRHSGLDLGERNPDVVALSEYLRRLPWHVGAWKDESFRNTRGIVNKIHQLQTYAAGDEPYSIGLAVKRIALQYRYDHAAVHTRARAIREALSAQLAVLSEDLPQQSDETDKTYQEGRARFTLHRRQERNQQLVHSKLSSTKARTGHLACEVCSFDFEATYGELGKGFAECHHLLPLSVTGETETRLNDLAVVCANCHRMLHRRSPDGRLPTLEQLRTCIRPQ